MHSLPAMSTNDLDWIDQVLVEAWNSEGVNNSPIRYQITRTNEGVVLSVWEPAPVTADRCDPYLYIANYRLEAEEEAVRLLQHHLQMCSSNLPDAPDLPEPPI